MGRHGPVHDRRSDGAAPERKRCEIGRRCRRLPRDRRRRDAERRDRIARDERVPAGTAGRTASD
jgi:hypothetical protein